MCWGGSIKHRVSSSRSRPAIPVPAGGAGGTAESGPISPVGRENCVRHGCGSRHKPMPSSSGDSFCDPDVRSKPVSRPSRSLLPNCCGPVSGALKQLARYTLYTCRRGYNSAYLTSPALATGVDIVFFNQYELAKRWRLSPRTLERFRYERKGPPYVKIGGRVVYRVTDIVAYETKGLVVPAVEGAST